VRRKVNPDYGVEYDANEIKIEFQIEMVKSKRAFLINCRETDKLGVAAHRVE
jgi:hypothetical protein